MGKRIVERRNTILDMVNTHGTLSFARLREAFPNVSDVTLRKDLQFLDDTQRVVRIHGGIKSIPSALNYYYRANVNIDKKKAIAEKAAALLKPGDLAFISAGTTCAALARRLPNFPLMVCSDGIYTVSNISAHPNISVELLGGDVDLNIMRVEGISVLNRLDSMHFSIAFTSAIAVNPDYGVSHNSAMTAAILKKVIENSDKVVVLLDSTKVTKSLYPHTISLASVDIIVTDDDFPAEVAQCIRAKGIEVI